MYSLPDSADMSKEEWIFLMMDVRAYIRAHGAAQFVHDLEDLYPEEYALVVNAIRMKEIKDFNTKKGVLLDAHQGGRKPA